MQSSNYEVYGNVVVNAAANYTYNDYAEKSIQFFGNDNYNYNYPFAYQSFDLNGYVVKNPSTSFLIKVKGDSMVGAGINNADVLLVDRSAKPINGAVVVAEINGKLVVKRLVLGVKKIQLLSENKKYMPIIVNNHDDFKIWGVVQSVIKTM